MNSRTACIIIASDSSFRGEREDLSGPEAERILTEAGYLVKEVRILPDDRKALAEAMAEIADAGETALIVTSGGTGFSPRDVTPEATKAVIERETPGIPELMRAQSMKITNRGCLSRSAAGIRGRSLIINLPGSEKAARENLIAVIDSLEHGLQMLHSEGSADCAAPDCINKNT